MYTRTLILGGNISTECLSLYDILTLEAVDSVSLISFTHGFSISSWSS